MERVHRLAERAARSSIPVLIEGERGVGKELIARAIHGSGPQRGRPFLRVNCGETDEAEIDAVLSGSRKGAASGRTALQPNGATLFLDEIGVLSPASQETLARRLAAKETPDAPNGRRTSGNVRLIAATSRRLIDLVREEGFLEELFYRLNVLPIWLPPLREMQADIPHLARSLLARLAAEAGRPSVKAISPAAMALLTADPWPGNIREMERTIFRAIMLCEGSELTSREFPSVTARSGDGATRDRAAVADGHSGLPKPAAGVAVQEQDAGVRHAPSARIADFRPAARYGVTRLLDDRGELRPFEVLEEEVIRFAVEHYGGRMSEVARRLGIGRSTLYRKIRDYGIAPGESAVS
jgi:DNA-binding NtrC family response regulator